MLELDDGSGRPMCGGDVTSPGPASEMRLTRLANPRLPPFEGLPMPNRLAVALSSAALLALPLAASAQAVESGAYKLEPMHTEVVFDVLHMGFTKYFGVFSGASGSLVLDAANPAASKLDVSVPVSSVFTPSDRLAGELKSAQWLDAGKYPAMTFHSTSIVSTGPTTADVTGDLPLHGVTHPEVLHVSFNHAAANPMNKAYTAGFQATGVIKRSDFGVSTYVPLISDEVDLTISAAFEKTPS